MMGYLADDGGLVPAERCLRPDLAHAKRHPRQVDHPVRRDERQRVHAAVRGLVLDRKRQLRALRVVERDLLAQDALVRCLGGSAHEHTLARLVALDLRSADQV